MFKGFSSATSEIYVNAEEQNGNMDKILPRRARTDDADAPDQE